MEKLVEKPCITLSQDMENITIHSYINMNGKMVLDKSEAALLYIELHKFLML